MRTLKELYGVLIERMESEDAKRECICWSISYLWACDKVTIFEKSKLELHFDSIPRPTAESHPHLAKYLTPESCFYFQYGLKEPRIAFLKEIQNSLP